MLFTPSPAKGGRDILDSERAGEERGNVPCWCGPGDMGECVLLAGGGTVPTVKGSRQTLYSLIHSFHRGPP